MNTRGVPAGLEQSELQRALLGQENAASEVAVLPYEPMTVAVRSDVKAVGGMDAKRNEVRHGSAWNRFNGAL